nr:hypothetical protein PJ912_04310 [Pectobacterium colocasium]
MTWQKMVLGTLLTLSLQAGAAQKPVDVTIGVAGSEDAYWKVLAQKAKAENINIKLISVFRTMHYPIKRWLTVMSILTRFNIWLSSVSST